MSRTHIISVCLIGTGAITWVLAGRPLVRNAELNVPLNPLGINGSPYGEVFAMAMQGPIDSYFVGGLVGGAAKPRKSNADKPADRNKWKSPESFVASLGEIAEVSTNPKSVSEAHKVYLRRQAEDKLRFAYQLDPSHYGNYTSLHFFLTEPQVGTRPELTPSAAKLAQDTISYCLAKEDDPRPALTAAAAATNMMHLMFADRQSGEQPKFATTDMRRSLEMLDHSIARYVTVAKQWDESKNWDLLSPQRIAECDDRFSFIVKIRDAAEKAIIRFENESPVQAGNSPEPQTSEEAPQAHSHGS